MTTTTTTKYELTDADRKRLDAIAQEASGKPKVNDTAWKVACDWFASLPVVSREAAERALGEATKEEVDECKRNHLDREGRGFQSYRYALDCFLANRRAMLDVVEAEPPKAAPVLAGDDLRKRLDWQIREIVRERGARVRAGKDGDVGNRIHWGVASAMTSLYDSLFSRPLDDDLGWNAGFGSNSPEPTPEPQPAIDVVAELAELRKAADRCLATLGAHRTQIDDAIATIGLMLETQESHRGTIQGNARLLELQSECLDDFRRRLTALESANQRKPRWWWW